MSPDFVNAMFETLGGFVILLNIKRLFKDKLVRGVDWKVTAFFTAWGLWNIFYYPYLGQSLSFYAGLFIVGVNTWQLWLMIYYVRKEQRYNQALGLMEKTV